MGCHSSTAAAHQRREALDDPSKMSGFNDKYLAEEPLLQLLSLVLAGRSMEIHSDARCQSFALRKQSSLVLDISSLMQVKAPVQERVHGVLAARLGLGQSAPENLALRKALCKPGPPYGGVGFFEWTAELEQEIPDSEVAIDESGFEPSFDAELSSSVVKLKLREFQNCANFDLSVYFWVLHPIFDSNDRVVGAEVLVRARNGTDSAPFEDVHALMDPTAPPDVKQVYAKWKGAEIVDWPMRALSDFPVLQRLRFLSVNVRPSDLCTDSLIFHEVVRRLRGLPDEDRRLLLSMVCIEVCEDQEQPSDIKTSLAAWQELGFRCAYDDTISELTCKALGQPCENFHTTHNLEPLLTHFWLVKVDMNWAGHMLFLCHPCHGRTLDRKAEVLRRARVEGLVYVAQGPSSLRNTGVKHADVLAEFAAWAQHVILHGKRICIELTVRQDDPNCALAIEGLRENNIDIFGKHSDHFCFQGGLCGPKAFEPSQLAEHCI